MFGGILFAACIASALWWYACGEFFAAGDRWSEIAGVKWVWVKIPIVNIQLKPSKRRLRLGWPGNPEKVPVCTGVCCRPYSWARVGSKLCNPCAWRRQAMGLGDGRQKRICDFVFVLLVGFVWGLWQKRMRYKTYACVVARVCCFLGWNGQRIFSIYKPSLVRVFG